MWNHEDLGDRVLGTGKDRCGGLAFVFKVVQSITDPGDDFGFHSVYAGEPVESCKQRTSMGWLLFNSIVLAYSE